MNDFEGCRVVKEELNKKKTDVLLVFIQEGCPVCEKAQKYLFEELEIPENLIDNLPKTVSFVEVDKCGDYGFNVDVTPTFIRIRDGKEIGRVEGFNKEGIFWILTLRS